MTRKQAVISLIGFSGALILGIFHFKFYFYSNARQLKLLNNYRELISEISDIIIPHTNTPGAKDAKIVDYIIRVVKNCIPERDRITLISGLADLEKYSYDRFSLSFLQCSKAEQKIILQHYESGSLFLNPFFNKVKRKLFGPSFFEIIKEMTINCYCTSMIGATQGLAYDRIPVNYIGCEPYVKKQRSWALR